jgi:outer membrane protein OmpA-like peptidoglycan-associated protein
MSDSFDVSFDGGFMTFDARRAPGRTVDAAGLSGREPRGNLRRALLGGAVLAAMLTGAAGPLWAQETVIIGSDRGGTAIIGTPRSSVVINNEVLDSLGAGGPAPGLPYQPQAVAPVARGQMQIIAPGQATTAYRLPGTGQLVVSRPSTLLFPPLHAPGSRLTVPTPGRTLAQAPSAVLAPTPEPELQSRLLVPLPEPRVEPAPPIEPVSEEPVVEIPPPAPEPEPEPEPQVAALPPPAPEPPPAPAITLAPAPPPEPEPEPETAMPAPEPEPEPEPETPVASEAPVAPPPVLTQEPAAAAEPPPAPEPPAQAEAPPPPSQTLIAKKPEETQTAALPPVSEGLKQTRLTFKSDSAELTRAMKKELEALAGLLQRDESVRIQLMAYARSSDGSPSRARRLSLSRALAVRAFLIDNGVRSTRMDVRALGDKGDGGPADRVDILPQTAGQ